MQGKWVALTAVLVAAGAAGGVLAFRRHHVPPAPPARAAGALELPASGIVTFTGAIRAQHVATVGASVDGNIEMFLADVGQEVFQGDALARIASPALASDRESAANAVERARDQVARLQDALNAAILEKSRAEADLERGQAEMDRAHGEYDKQRGYYAKGATPRRTFEKSETDYKDAADQFQVLTKALDTASESARNCQAAVDAAQKVVEARLADLDEAQGNAEAAAEVRSPVDGVVVTRNGEPGKPAREFGDQMFVIATDLSALEVTVEPPPPVLKRIVPGLPAMVLVPELTSAGFEGEVKGIDKGAVVVQFVSGLSDVRPGMKADVRIKLE
jgi:multidrug resistance efflux pump